MNNNEEKQMQVAISSDTVALIYPEEQNKTTIIKGNDKSAVLLEGFGNKVTELIHKCLDAREQGYSINITIDGEHVITFH